MLQIALWMIFEKKYLRRPRISCYRVICIYVQHQRWTRVPKNHMRLHHTPGIAGPWCEERELAEFAESHEDVRNLIENCYFFDCHAKKCKCV